VFVFCACVHFDAGESLAWVARGAAHRGALAPCRAVRCRKLEEQEEQKLVSVQCIHDAR